MAMVDPSGGYVFDPNQRNGNGGIMPPGYGYTSSPTYSPSVPGASPSTGSASPATDFGGGMVDQQLRQIGDAWRKYYGNDPTDSQARQYLGNANYESAIQQAASQQKPTSPFDINSWGQNWLKSGGRTLQDFQNYVGANPLGAGYSLSGSKGDKVVGPGGSGWDAVIGAGAGGQGASWSPFGAGGPAAAPATSGSIFSDPATQQWEQLIRTLTDRLQQPQPTWTPAQLELQQTQLLDPLERQRQVAKQQVTQRFAQMGHGQNSGPLQQALQQVDQQFNQMETQARAQVANQATNREDQLFASNENRALAAAGLFGQIPQYADTRMMLGNNVLQQMNPTSLLGLMNAFQNTGFNQNYLNNQQNQAFWGQLMNYLSPLFG